MGRIIGSYGIWESLVSMVFFGWLVFFNSLFLRGVIQGEHLNDQIIFMVVFVDLVGLVIVALPYIVKKAGSISNEKINEFLDLPTKESKFTFNVLSDFLSNQALASFLGTVLIFTGKQAVAKYGGEIAAIYIFFLYVISIALSVFSLVRFISYFTRYHWVLYALGASLSTGIMFAFFTVGIKLGA